MSLDTEIGILQAEWAKVESHLARAEPSYFKIPRNKVHLIPGGGARMAEIDREIDRLSDERSRILPNR